MKTTVMCFGTFDLLHLGHLHYFSQAKEHADRLVVVVARDKTKEHQQKETVFTENERLDLITSLSIVDEAVLGNFGDHLKVIKERKPDVICLGYDHPVNETELAERLLPFHVFPKIVRATPYNPSRHKSNHIRDFVLAQK